ncbi:MAG: C4-dicarboxylate ABC transporter permease [Betaproteobacteria bacterium RIFCSPLOWO2_12_FULL_67_28]|nr:MAG: C4-dicarboxylate ABC transporter permease [Betaproteobacteria bacterium RIFCSPLOWO2_12_FULL_67_28]
MRVLRPVLACAIALGSLLWAIDFYRFVGLLFLPEQYLAATFAAALALVFLHYPATQETARGPLPWYDALLAITGFATGAYVAYDFPDLSTRMFEAPIEGLITSSILLVLTAEGLRRTVGAPLVIILAFFIVYSLVGHLVPGAMQTREVQFDRMMVYLGVDTSALFGLIMMVGVTVVIPFLFFGQLLSESGGAGFFNDLSLGLMGRFRGGAAKIAILASSLFGTISGVVVSNILATGVITIPMMKKSGFSPQQAAAVEATASNGGQLMPPVMGAVAFVMADFLQRPYRDIVIAALVPSLLYYISLFIQVDLEAAKMGIKRVPEEDIPRLAPVLKSGFVFIIPFAVLIYLLFWENREAEFAALIAALAVAGIGIVLGYKGLHMKFRVLIHALTATGLASLDILIIAAAAGFIGGILQATGFGFALTLLLVKIGAGNLVALLIIAAILCIVLGMGMPTIGVYVLLSVLVAPSLVEVGFSPLASHMFILYLGMMSMITPPVAIGAFFAASLAGAPPMRTGFVAMRLGWTAYIVPFLFMFSPALLLQGGSTTETVVAIATAIIGVWLISAGMVGYLAGPMVLWLRIGFVLSGICLLIPDQIADWAFWTDMTGAIAGGLMVACQVLLRPGKSPAPAPTSGDV